MTRTKKTPEILKQKTMAQLCRNNKILLEIEYGIVDNISVLNIVWELVFSAR